MFEEVLLAKLYLAYLEARKGKRKTFDEHVFELNDFENLMSLRDDIIERVYQPSRSEAFITFDPVIREIFAAPFRDRVVHHFIYDVVVDWWDRRFVEDSYSCRVNKGVLYGLKRFERHARSVTNNFKDPAFVAKLDIQGYFMSLERRKLYERAIWGLDRQFAGNKRELYHTVRFLWEKVIFDDPVRGMRTRGSWKDWEKLPKSKSLLYQPEGRGIVIGNLTSQLLSNIYLDQLDRFVTMDLGYKHYGRYVDDFYIIVNMRDKEKLLADVGKIELYLKLLGLTLHPKKRIFTTLDKGVDFVGSKMFEGYILPGKRVRGKTKRAMVHYAEGRGELESVVSYMGHLQHINSRKFIKGMFDELGWDYGEDAEDEAEHKK